MGKKGVSAMGATPTQHQHFLVIFETKHSKGSQIKLIIDDVHRLILTRLNPSPLTPSGSA